MHVLMLWMTGSIAKKWPWRNSIHFTHMLQSVSQSVGQSVSRSAGQFKCAVPQYCSISMHAKNLSPRSFPSHFISSTRLGLDNITIRKLAKLISPPATPYSVVLSISLSSSHHQNYNSSWPIFGSLELESSLPV